MTNTETVLQGKDSALGRHLYISFELGDKTWKLTFGDGRRAPSRCTVIAGEQAAVLERIARAKQHFGLDTQAQVHSCYEAGRDGWWLHRWLGELGLDSIVVDAASIELNRRARQAKTDRLDGDKLLAMLLRWHAGERRVWSVLREPSVEQEDERRVPRERERLQHERTAHTNRIGSLLVLHNLRVRRIGGREWASWWMQHSAQVPPVLRAEIERELVRLELLKQQLRAIDALQREQLQANQHPRVSQLVRLRCIGVRGAWMLVKELFGWRHFANRRELAGCLGMTPTPYNSGTSQREQGISKSGNKRARALLVELAWMWLRLQPDSDLTHWFNRRFATAGSRMRRVGIVALARRLAVALWRFLEHGEIPKGASLKPVVQAAPAA
jgi:transposase